MTTGRELEIGYYICKSCNGTGDCLCKYCNQESNMGSSPVRCQVCNGSGKLDWIKNALRNSRESMERSKLWD